MSNSNGLYLDLSHYFKEERFKAGFTQRSFPFESPIDRQQLAYRLNLDKTKLVIPKQIHGNTVKVLNDHGIIQNTDSIISWNRNIVLSIQVADCIPLFLLDKNLKYSGLIHAGWRGTASGIIEETLKTFESVGSQLIDIITLIGPSIRQCCYEVGPEVAKVFKFNHLKASERNRSFLDLQGVVKTILTQSGIISEHIYDMNECTCCQPEKYYSFRRDGEKTGRMIAMSGWV